MREIRKAGDYIAELPFAARARAQHWRELPYFNPGPTGPFPEQGLFQADVALALKGLGFKDDRLLPQVHAFLSHAPNDEKRLQLAQDIAVLRQYLNHKRKDLYGHGHDQRAATAAYTLRSLDLAEQLGLPLSREHGIMRTEATMLLDDAIAASKGPARGAA